jgi:hypothetical protein
MSGSEEGSVPPLGDDIPEEDWDAANEDGATGTEEDDADAESYDTEDEDPAPEDVGHRDPLFLLPFHSVSASHQSHCIST